MRIHKGAGPREVPGSSRHAARLHTGKPGRLLHADRQPGGGFTFGMEGDREKARPTDLSGAAHRCQQLLCAPAAQNPYRSNQGTQSYSTLIP